MAHPRLIVVGITAACVLTALTACSSKQASQKSSEPATPPPQATTQPARLEADTKQAPTESTTPAVEAPAQQILDEVIAKYADMRTYRDSGTCTTEILLTGTTITDSKPFTTAFERDGRFRFQFRHAKSPGGPATELYTVWSADGKTFDTASTARKKTQHALPLTAAIARPTGLSNGATRATIPLLMKDAGIGPVVDLINPKLIGHETVEGAACSQIAGTRTDGTSITLWIADDRLIRRVRIEQDVDTTKLPVPPDSPNTKGAKFTAKTTIELVGPSVNTPIPSEAFTPPEPLP